MLVHIKILYTHNYFLHLLNHLLPINLSCWLKRAWLHKFHFACLLSRIIGICWAYLDVVYTIHIGIQKNRKRKRAYTHTLSQRNRKKTMCFFNNLNQILEMLLFGAQQTSIAYIYYYTHTYIRNILFFSLFDARF